MKLRPGLVGLGVMGAGCGVLVLLLLSGDEGRDRNTSARGERCPEAQAVFRSAGVPEIEHLSGQCPDADELAADLAQATVSGREAREARLVRKALEQGRISEGQNPSTYPPDIRRLVD